MVAESRAPHGTRDARPQPPLRHKGSSNEYKRQQDAEIMAAYRRIFTLYGGLASVQRLYELTAFAPASRFFVSELQAVRVVTRMAQGKPVHAMRGARLRMYTEILRRATAMRDGDPRLGLAAAVAAVVRQPAPEMYVSPRQVAAIIKEERRKTFDERRSRLRHTS